MCGKPKVVQQDPEGDARKAAEKATLEANAKKAMRRGSSGSALSTGGDYMLEKNVTGRIFTKYFPKKTEQLIQEHKSKLGGG